MIGRFILRLIVIVIAASVALGAAGTAAMMLFYTNEIVPRAEVEFEFEVMESFFDLAYVSIVTFTLAGELTLLPAVLIIAAAEAFRLKGWVFYGAAGAVLASAPVILSGPIGLDPIDTQYLASVAAAGIAGGLVYWLLAGRYAGEWWAGGRPLS